MGSTCYELPCDRHNWASTHNSETAFGTLCSQAGWHVQYEQPIPGTQGEKIMDLVVTGTPNSQTMAFDVTVVNPVAPSGPEVVSGYSNGRSRKEETDEV